MLVRGFKAKAERLAASIRQDAGLNVMDRLDPLSLARRLGIDAITVSELGEFGASSRSVRRLLSPDAPFSALTICVGAHRLIVYNEQHPPGRRANSLAHELSHVILKHPASPALFEGGQRYWDARLEDEANWLAGALLVPRDGAFGWLRAGGDMADGAQHFGVSLELFRWRANQTGVVHQLRAMALL